MADPVLSDPAVAAPVKVDIWSDVACPWCFIGKRRFEAAVAAFDGEVEVEFHSYLLAPDTPEDYPGTHEDYLVSRGFPREQIAAMDARVGGIAESVGLHYDMASNHPTSTVKAHQLIHYAKAHGRQAEMKERLMAAYFERGEHVGRVDELVRMAEEVGLDGAEARAALETERYLPAVQADFRQAAAYGINGVPFYVVQGKYGVSGAQPTELFLDVLHTVQAELAGAGARSDAGETAASAE